MVSCLSLCMKPQTCPKLGAVESPPLGFSAEPERCDRNEARPNRRTIARAKQVARIIRSSYKPF